MSQDPRRLDPRRLMVPVDVPPTSVLEDNIGAFQHPAVQSDVNPISSSSVHISVPQSVNESASQPPMPIIQTDINLPDFPETIEVDESIQKDQVFAFDADVITTDNDSDNFLHVSPPSSKAEDIVSHASIDVAMLDEAYSPSSEESDELPPDVSNVEASESTSAELPMLPLYIELDEDHQIHGRRLALERIINKYQNSQRTDIKQTQIALVARLFAQACRMTQLINCGLSKINFFLSISFLFVFEYPETGASSPAYLSVMF